MRVPLGGRQKPLLQLCAKIFSHFQSTERWICRHFWKVYCNSRPKQVPWRSYLFYCPLCSIRCRRWRSYPKQNVIYRIFASFSANSCFSFLIQWTASRHDSWYINCYTSTNPASNIGFQGGKYTDEMRMSSGWIICVLLSLELETHYPLNFFR